jgi:hypothetical protein
LASCTLLGSNRRLSLELECKEKKTLISQIKASVCGGYQGFGKRRHLVIFVTYPEVPITIVVVRHKSSLCAFSPAWPPLPICKTTTQDHYQTLPAGRSSRDNKLRHAHASPALRQHGAGVALLGRKHMLPSLADKPSALFRQNIACSGRDRVNHNEHQGECHESSSHACYEIPRVDFGCKCVVKDRF